MCGFGFLILVIDCKFMMCVCVFIKVWFCVYLIPSCRIWFCLRVFKFGFWWCRDADVLKTVTRVNQLKDLGMSMPLPYNCIALFSCWVNVTKECWFFRNNVRNLPYDLNICNVVLVHRERYCTITIILFLTLYFLSILVQGGMRICTYDLVIG